MVCGSACGASFFFSSVFFRNRPKGVMGFCMFDVVKRVAAWVSAKRLLMYVGQLVRKG
jgi:hypothetical protein